MLAAHVADRVNTRREGFSETAVAALVNWECARSFASGVIFGAELDELFRASECSSSPRSPNPDGSIDRNLLPLRLTSVPGLGVRRKT